MTGFARDARGGVVVIFALALLPIIAFIGIVIDYGRAITERTAYQSALDSALLAATVLNLPDDQRLQRARETFAGSLKSGLQTRAVSSEFTMDAAKTKVSGRVLSQTPALFGAFLKVSALDLEVDASAVIARPQVRQLDLVMCIDGTGSMTPTLNAVKSNALNFEANLNAELQTRGVAKFDVIRVRPIIYRDYGGNFWYDQSRGGWTYTASGWRLISGSDPDRARHVGDVPAITAAPFYNLTVSRERSAFSGFVGGQSAWGGGDLPESGLECVAEGIASAWGKVGDSANGKTITSVHPAIVVWTDADAQPPSWPASLRNPDYPPEAKMPRSHRDMEAWWNDSARIDQGNKLLVFFGGVFTNPQGWVPTRTWNGYYYGGTLADGNTQMVRKIVDGLVNRLSQPTLTQ